MRTRVPILPLLRPLMTAAIAAACSLTALPQAAIALEETEMAADSLDVAEGAAVKAVADSKADADCLDVVEGIEAVEVAGEGVAEVDVRGILSEACVVQGVRPPVDNLYQYPYSMWRQAPCWKRLWQNTAVLFGAGFAALGVLELLPENATAWNKAKIHSMPFFRRWWEHVKAGPVWDSDQPLFNYILHPYSGAAYYMAARSQGLNVLGSFAYVTFISTIFWEYGIESFNEVPSIQDLILTPIGGMVLGEMFYLAKRRIVDNGYRLLGSAVLGNAVAVLIDPANEVLGLIFGNSARQLVRWRKAQMELQSAWGPVSAGRAQGFGLSITASF